MSKTLPVIIQEAEALTNALLQFDGEITPELESQLAMSGQELRDKLDSYGYVIEALKMRQAYALQRLKEWEKVASGCDNALENIKSRIKHSLEQLDLPEVHGFEYSFRLQANPPSVIVDDENAIPEEFKTTEVKTTVKISKKDILDALKDGRVVPGAHAERSTKLVTKVSQRKDLKSGPMVERL
jgi:Siphovirus Gp157